MANRILILEWLCGGGLCCEDLHPVSHPELLKQGKQMLAAVCEDFTHAGWQVITPIDARIQLNLEAQQIPVQSETDFNETLHQESQRANQILIIAPETGGRLTSIIHQLEHHRSKLLNPGYDFTRLASDKNRMQTLLARHAIPVPVGIAVASSNALPDTGGPHKFIVKPADGCGGEELRVVRSENSRDEVVSNLLATTNGTQSMWRLEELIPGLAASVSCIRTVNETHVLPPLRQVFDDNRVGRFSHCEADLSRDHAARAVRLMEQVLEALPPFQGFIGVDCVLGARDVVVEVNPRLTMSYCTTRQNVPFNLAEKMLGERSLLDAHKS